MPANLDLTAGITALVLLFTQLLKVLIIDPHLLKPDDPAHDTLVRTVSYVLSVGLSLAAFGVPFSGPAAIGLLIAAIGPSGVAIAGYHVISGSSFTAGLLARQRGLGAALSTQPAAASGIGGGTVGYTQGPPSGWLPPAGADPTGAGQRVYTPPAVAPAVPAAPEPKP